ncbi:MAG: hypothetical protein IJ566_07155 [Cardiobacteriaceae bacterium]|nr:hypothetical protein [Cardiobacteriaceae bacterium]
MQIFFRIFRFVAVLLTAILMLPSFALDNYRAVYDLEIRGVSAGTVVYEGFFTDITYRIDTVGKPSTAAVMLGFGEIRESVKGLLQAGKVQPQFYQRSMQGKADYALEYKFTPEKNQIAVKKAGADSALSYEQDQKPLDTISMVLQSVVDIENSSLPKEYTLITEDHMRVYQIEKMPDQKWKSRAGKTLSVMVYRQRNGERENIVYFAKEPLRLVRLEQLRKGKRHFLMNLTDYRTL